MPLSDTDLSSLTEGLKSGTLGGSLNQATRENPDKWVKDKKTADTLGITVPAVRNDPAEAERQSNLSSTDMESLLADKPQLTKFLSNPDNAKVSWDDTETLGALEHNFNNRSWYEWKPSSLKGLGDSMMIGLGKIADELAVGFLSEDIPYLPKHLEEQGYTLESLKAERKIELDQRLESLRVAEDEIARLTPENLTAMEESVRGAGQMVSDVLPGMAISLATKGKINPTLPWLTAKTGLSSYGQARTEGLEQGQAMVYGGADAALEYLTEVIPMKALEGMLGETMKGGLKSSLIKFFAGELGGEQVATLTQSINAAAHGLDKELLAAETWEERIAIQGRRQAITLLTTAMGSGTISGAVKGLDYAVNHERRVANAAVQAAVTRLQSQESQGWLDDHIALAQSSLTNERDFATFQSFLEQFDADDTHVFISADIVSELEGAPDYMVEQLDGTGADVSILMSQFLTDFANSDQLEFLRPHIKVREDLQSQSQIEEGGDSEQMKRLIEQANASEEARKEFAAIEDQVVEQLIATRRQGRATATKSAQLWSAVMMAKQAELKAVGQDVSLAELFEPLGIKIVGPGVDVPAEARMMSQDPFIVSKGNVGYTDERIDYLFREYGYLGDETKTKAAVAYINPADFIPTTTVSPEMRDTVISETQKLDPEKLKGEMQTPFLYVKVNTLGDLEVVSHEGRHRMEALRRDGYKKVPVILVMEGTAKTGVFDDRYLISGQKEGKPGSKQSARAIRIQNTTPISYNNYDQIHQMFGAESEANLLFQDEQDFGDLELSDIVDDNEVKIKAQKMWDYHQARLDAIEQIERCMRG